MCLIKHSASPHALSALDHSTITKSELRSVRNCLGELALRFEMVASFYMCQPNHSFSRFMFSLHIQGSLQDNLRGG